MCRISLTVLLLLLVGCASHQRVVETIESPNIRVSKSSAPFYPRRQLLPQYEEIIVIDPGHGGEDRGTASLTNPKYHEKYLNLSTARFLRDYLKQLGYKTILTRNDDTFISLSDRATLANQAGSNLFVSVHYNSAPSREASGIEVFYYNAEKEKERARASKELASVVLKNVIDNTQAKSRGVKHGNLAVIRETQMPAILIEGGFMTNQEEMDRIKDPVYVKSLAWGIANGIDEYLRQKT